MAKEEPTAETEMAMYCFDVVAAHFTRTLEPAPAFLTGAVCPMFVTWRRGSNLRGCIGCLQPLPITSLRDYALTAALRDKRFTPMEEPEMSGLDCTVSLLTHFELASHHLDWDVTMHGIMIEFVDPAGVSRSATYLPEVVTEQGWTKLQAIDSLIAKAGYKRVIDAAVRGSLRTTRYRSTKASATYAHWAQARKLLHQRSMEESVVAGIQAAQHQPQEHGSEPPQFGESVAL